MNAKEIYEAIFLAKETSHTKLEKDAKLGAKSVYRAVSGNYSSLSAGTAKKIHALYPDLSLAWLSTGEGEMYAPPVSNTGRLLTPHGRPAVPADQQSIAAERYNQQHDMVSEPEPDYTTEKPIPASDMVEVWKMAAQAYKETAAAKEEALQLYRKMEAEREKAATAYVSREMFGELQLQFFGVQDMTAKYLSQLTGIPIPELLVESRKVSRAQAQTRKTNIHAEKGT